MAEATYPPSPEVYLRGQHDQKLTEVMQMIAVASQRDVTIANQAAEIEALKTRIADLDAELATLRPKKTEDPVALAAD